MTIFPINDNFMTLNYFTPVHNTELNNSRIIRITYTELEAILIMIDKRLNKKISKLIWSHAEYNALFVFYSWSMITLLSTNDIFEQLARKKGSTFSSPKLLSSKLLSQSSVNHIKKLNNLICLNVLRTEWGMDKATYSPRKQTLDTNMLIH